MDLSLSDSDTIVGLHYNNVVVFKCHMSKLVELAENTHLNRVPTGSCNIN